MIQVSTITKSYGTEVLFEDVSFTVGPRERVGLVGRNGHGKTTLFHIILGMVEPDAGSVAIPNGYTIGHLEQHLDFTQPTARLEAGLGLPPEAKDDAWRAESILSGLGFTQEYMDYHPSDLSGGFQVRLSLAKLLVSDPDMLLLDEPTNYLDIVSIRWLSRFLGSWKRELMLITHDRSFMDSVITHTVGIHRKRARKIAGSTDKYYEQITKEEEVYEKTRLNDERKRREVELFIRRFRAKAQLGSLVQSRIKTLQKRERPEKLEKLPALEFSFRSAPFPAKTMLEVRGLSFSYDDRLPHLIDSLSLSMGSQDRIAVIGPNGKGKSTLLKLLAGELMPNGGEIRRHSRTRTGYYGQTNVEHLAPGRTVVEEVQAASADCSNQQAMDICGAMMFSEDLALKKVEVLSGGEKSRVLLGKILVSPCNLLLLDEPTNHLDMESCDSLLAAIDSFGGAAVVVTHNEMYLHTLANRLIVFDRGRVFVYEGSYQEFLEAVGWENDGAELQVRGNGKATRAAAGEAISQKAYRQAMAEMVRERSRALKPLATKVEQLEAGIQALEAELVQNELDLTRASEAGDGPAIVELAKRNHDIRAETELLYEALDEATRQYEEGSRQFEARAEEIEAKARAG